MVTAYVDPKTSGAIAVAASVPAIVAPPTRKVVFIVSSSLIISTLK